MKKANVVLIGLFITFVIFFFAYAQAQQASDETEIKKIVTKYESAYNSGDSKAIASLWNQDGDLFTLSGGIFRGRAEIETFFSKTLSANYKDSQFHLTIDQIRLLGEKVAVIDGEWRITGTSLPQNYPSSGIYTQILFKSDGEWRISAARPSVPLGGHTRNHGR